MNQDCQIAPEKISEGRGNSSLLKGKKMKKASPVVLYLLLVFYLSIPVHAQSFDLRIFHMNDFHGFAEPYKPLGSRQLLGGMAHLAGRAKDLRSEKPTLLLAAGGNDPGK